MSACPSPLLSDSAAGYSVMQFEYLDPTGARQAELMA